MGASGGAKGRSMPQSSRTDRSAADGDLSRSAGTIDDDPEIILAENRMRHEAGRTHRGVGFRLAAGIVDAHMGGWKSSQIPCQGRSACTLSARPRQSTTKGWRTLRARMKHFCTMGKPRPFVDTNNGSQDRDAG